MNAILLLAAVLNVSAGTSLQDAFDRVAAHRAVHPDDASVEVVFAPGEYPQTEAAVLTPAAGGDSACRVVYRSADPTHPAVVSGGRRIMGWQVGTDGVWRVTLPEVKARRWNFTRLFADGVRRSRPRFPAEGYSLTVSELGEPRGPRALQPPEVEHVPPARQGG